MKEILLFTTIFLIVTLISYLWVRGIDKMKNEYPDYKGEDLFNEETKDDENSIY